MSDLIAKKYIEIKWLEKKLIDRMLESKTESMDTALHVLFDLLKEWRDENITQ